MLNKGKAIGFVLSGVAFLAAGFVVGITGDLPAVFHMAVEAVAAVAGIFGIAFIAPNKNQK